MLPAWTISQISFTLFLSSGDRNKRKFGKKGRWEDLETKRENAWSLCHLLKLMRTPPVSTIPVQTKQTLYLLCTQQQFLCRSIFCVHWSWLHRARTTQNPAIACRTAEGLRCSCAAPSNMADVHLPAAGQLKSCLDFILWLSELGWVLLMGRPGRYELLDS